MLCYLGVGIFTYGHSHNQADQDIEYFQFSRQSSLPLPSQNTPHTAPTGQPFIDLSSITIK